MRVVRIDDTPAQRTTQPLFLGEVHNQPFTDGVSTQTRLNVVHFHAGGRTKWHTHDFEQLLFITEGRGIVADSQQEHEVTPGMVAIIPQDERHWHGGTPDSAMTHISIGRVDGKTTIVE